MVNILISDGAQNDEGAVPTRSRSSRRASGATAIVLVLLALHHVGFKIMYLPLNRLIENRFCRSFYAEHDPSVIPRDGIVPERLCKVNAVQQQLAALFGTIESLHLFIDLAVAIPFGIMSDRGYRRTVAALNFVGLAAMYAWLFGIGYMSSAVSPSLMLLGPLFSVIGGGECVFMSTISALVADIAVDSIDRTTLFAYVSSVTYIAHAVSPSLAGLALSYSLWLPFLLGLLILPIGALTAALLPTTVRSDHGRTEETEPLLATAVGDDAQNRKPETTDTIVDTTRSKLREIKKQIAGRRNFQILMGVFFLASFASSNSALLPQYISKRYNWSFAHSGYLLSIKALVNISLLAIVVPVVVDLLATRFDFEAGRISKLGAQVMFSISVIGVVLVALAPSVPYLIFAFFVYALGSAIPVFTLSLVAHPSVAGGKANANAIDYSVIMIGRFAGNMCGLPTMTVLWTKGIGLGGTFLGLPYFVSGLVYFAGILLVSMIQLSA